MLHVVVIGGLLKLPKNNSHVMILKAFVSLSTAIIAKRMRINGE